MAAKIQDRWMWVGLGVFLFAATKGIAYGLRRTVELNIIHNPDTLVEPPTTPCPEDSIAIGTLQTLAKSPNPDIARSATEVLLNRFVASDVERELWVDELFSHAAAARKGALNLLHLFDSERVGTAAPSKAAALRSLIDLSADKDTLAAQTIRMAYHHASSFNSRGIRGPMTELEMLSADLRNTGQASTIVCSDMTKQQTMPWIRAMRALVHMQHYGASQGSFFRALRRLHSAESSCDSQADRLSDSDEAGSSQEDHSSVDAWAADALTRLRYSDIDGDRANFPLRAWEEMARRPRRHEESPEETEVRRRRREAMVLHEGEGMVARGDIIQPYIIR